VRDNVAVGVAGRRLGSLLMALLGAPASRSREIALQSRARTLLESVALGSHGDEPADALAAGLRRKLEIARALATDPLLLMLDQPAAGLSPAEIAALDEQLVELRARGGPAVVLVEHHMDLVMAGWDHITVLEHGQGIAGGELEGRRHDRTGVVSAHGVLGCERSSHGRTQ